MEILSFEDLPHGNTSVEFEGKDHGGAGVSFFVVNAAPRRGPSLHTHEYPEIFVMLDGGATFRGPDGETEVSAGHVVVVPAGEPHGFTAGPDGSRQVNIHASPRFVTEWLEGEDSG